MKKFSNRAITFLTSLVKPNPMRDWYILLAISGAVFIGLLGTALYFFIGIQSGAIIVPKDSGTIPTPNVSREDLNTALDIYGERKLNFDSDNIEVPDVSNPAN